MYENNIKFHQIFYQSVKTKIFDNMKIYKNQIIKKVKICFLFRFDLIKRLILIFCKRISKFI